MRSPLAPRIEMVSEIMPSYCSVVYWCAMCASFLRVRVSVDGRPEFPPGLEHAVFLQRGDVVGADAEPLAEHFGRVLTEERRRLDPGWLAVDADGPRRHLE